MTRNWNWPYFEMGGVPATCCGLMLECMKSFIESVFERPNHFRIGLITQCYSKLKDFHSDSTLKVEQSTKIFIFSIPSTSTERAPNGNLFQLHLYSISLFPQCFLGFFSVVHRKSGTANDEAVLMFIYFHTCCTQSFWVDSCREHRSGQTLELSETILMYVITVQLTSRIWY